MQRMKHTVESSIQAFVDKTQERISTNLPRQHIHPLQPIRTTSVTPTHLENIQHPVADPNDGPGPIAIAPCQGDMTNGQSPFLGTLVVEDPQEEHIALHDLDLPPENFPPPGMAHVSQAEPRPSPYAQHLQNVEKNDIVYKIINHHGNKPIHQLFFNLHRENTTHNSLHTTPTLTHTPTTTTN